MTELTEFLEAADETTDEWNGLLRIPHEDGQHVQKALFVCLDEDFERKGPVLMAVASAGVDLGDVVMSIHAFVDGARVEPTVSSLGEELIITIQNA